MNEVEALIVQIRLTYQGNAWHGTSIIEALKDIDYRDASRRVLAGRHTIWELVDHMAVWLEVPVKIYREKKATTTYLWRRTGSPWGAVEKNG